MNFEDYIIDCAELDWSSLLKHWRWKLPSKYEVLLVNKFGDLFFVFQDGFVYRLDIGIGSLEKIADSRELFWNELSVHDKACDWLMIPLVDRLVKAGKILNKGECYSYRMLPILGGGYGIEDFLIKGLDFHYDAFGPIHEKLKDVPDGTKIIIKIVD